MSLQHFINKPITHEESMMLIYDHFGLNVPVSIAPYANNPPECHTLVDALESIKTGNVDQMSFVMASGTRVQHEGYSEIAGFGHYTSLHLRKNQSGKYTAYYADSLNGKAPEFIKDMLKANGIELIQLDCQRQEGMTCFHHALFNSVAMQQMSQSELDSGKVNDTIKLKNDGNDVIYNRKEFIGDNYEKLKIRHSQLLLEDSLLKAETPLPKPIEEILDNQKLISKITFDSKDDSSNQLKNAIDLSLLSYENFTLLNTFLADINTNVSDKDTKIRIENLGTQMVSDNIEKFQDVLLDLQKNPDLINDKQFQERINDIKYEITGEKESTKEQLKQAGSQIDLSQPVVRKQIDEIKKIFKQYGEELKDQAEQTKFSDRINQLFDQNDSKDKLDLIKSASQDPSSINSHAFGERLKSMNQGQRSK